MVYWEKEQFWKSLDNVNIGGAFGRLTLNKEPYLQTIISKRLNSKSLSGIGLYQPHKTPYKPHCNTLATALHILLSILRTKCVLSFHDTAKWYSRTPSFGTQVLLSDLGRGIYDPCIIYWPCIYRAIETFMRKSKEARGRDKITFFRRTTCQPQSDEPVQQSPAPGDTWAGLRHILSLVMFNNLRNAWRVHTFIWDTKRYRNTLTDLDGYLYLFSSMRDNSKHPLSGHIVS